VLGLSDLFTTSYNVEQVNAMVQGTDRSLSHIQLTGWTSAVMSSDLKQYVQGGCKSSLEMHTHRHV